MAKGKRSRGFFWGLIFGILLGAGGIYYYQNHYNKSDFEKETKKFEKKAKKKLEKAEEGVKEFFDKKE